MSRIFSVCCVCGVTYKDTLIDDGDMKTYYSHGFCSNDCAEHESIEVHYYEGNKLESGFCQRVGKDMYFNKERVNKYVNIVESGTCADLMEATHYGFHRILYTVGDKAKVLEMAMLYAKYNNCVIIKEGCYEV